MLDGPKIAVIMGIPDKRWGPNWPGERLDFEARKDELFKALQSAHPDVEFELFAIRKAEDADEVIKRKDEFDGLLVYFIGGAIPPKILQAGKPMILIEDPFTGVPLLSIYHKMKHVFTRISEEAMERAGVEVSRR